MASFGDQLFVGTKNGGNVAKYDINTGAAINVNFLTGLSSPKSVAIVSEPGAAIFTLLGSLDLLAIRRRR